MGVGEGGWEVLGETSAEMPGTILAGGQINWNRSFLKSRTVIYICREWVQV